MRISRTIPTTNGPRLVAETPMIQLTLNDHESSLLVDALRREAEAADAEGRFELSERLSRRATAIYEAGRVNAMPYRDFRPAPSQLMGLG